MDIDRLSSDFQYVSHLGQNIGLEDMMRLKLALLSFREEHKHDRVKFWGRVRGFYNDYYIMTAVTEQKGVSFPKREFFWSNDSFQFAPLVKIQDSSITQFLESQNGYFTGEHDKILREGQVDKHLEHFDADDDDQIIRKGNLRSRITELDRLSYVVHKIDHDCAVVPYSSHKTSQTGELLNNIGYSGQSPEEISRLANYRHYRDTEDDVRLNIYGKFLRLT